MPYHPPMTFFPSYFPPPRVDSGTQATQHEGKYSCHFHEQLLLHGILIQHNLLSVQETAVKEVASSDTRGAAQGNGGKNRHRDKKTG